MRCCVSYTLVAAGLVLVVASIADNVRKAKVQERLNQRYSRVLKVLLVVGVVYAAYAYYHYNNHEAESHGFAKVNALAKSRSVKLIGGVLSTLLVGLFLFWRSVNWCPSSGPSPGCSSIDDNQKTQDDPEFHRRPSWQPPHHGKPAFSMLRDLANACVPGAKATKAHVNRDLGSPQHDRTPPRCRMFNAVANDYDEKEEQDTSCSKDNSAKIVFRVTPEVKQD